MSSIKYAVNDIWQRSLEGDLPEKVDEVFSEGSKKWPATFAKEYCSQEELEKFKGVAFVMRSQGIETLILIGMGGSARGSKAIQSFFGDSPFELVFWEGSHPQMLAKISRLIEEKNVGLLWISKSGSTLESRANLSLFRQMFAQVPEYFITSHPEKIADLNPAPERTFLIPVDLSGRYSVVSPVGILPGFFVGADMFSFMEGFREGIGKWDVAYPFSGNTAKQIAWQYYQLLRSHYHGVVFWIYCVELLPWGDWLLQLWSESLGKSTGTHALPILARGPEDQHSLQQFFLDGPNHYLHTFFHTTSYGMLDTSVSSENSDELTDCSQWDILSAQMHSVASALSRKAYPVSLFELPGLYSGTNIQMQILGEWMSFWMFMITYIAYLYQVNPFSQPAIEVGKSLMQKHLDQRKNVFEQVGKQQEI